MIMMMILIKYHLQCWQAEKERRKERSGKPCDCGCGGAAIGTNIDNIGSKPVERSSVDNNGSKPVVERSRIDNGIRNNGEISIANYAAATNSNNNNDNNNGSRLPGQTKGPPAPVSSHFIQISLFQILVLTWVTCELTHSFAHSLFHTFLGQL